VIHFFFLKKPRRTQVFGLGKVRQDAQPLCNYHLRNNGLSHENSVIMGQPYAPTDYERKSLEVSDDDI
jgi:hypothetical protein